MSTVTCPRRFSGSGCSAASPKTNLQPQPNDIPNYNHNTHPTMAERELQDIQRKLKSSRSYDQQLPLLSSAKLALLKLKSLTPLPTTPSSTLSLARDIFETGALLSIRAKDPAAFTRYVHQLTPFYELPAERLAPSSEKNKITGLYLLLLLTQGDYAGFHTELEGLELRGGLPGGNDVEHDRFLGYPIKLERWLQEGSFDLVWKAMASREVPSEEYGVFSEVCIPSLISLSSFTCPFMIFVSWNTPKDIHLPYITNNIRLITYTRSSQPTSAPRSPLAAKPPTLPSPSPRLRTFYSSTAKAPSSSSRRPEAG